MRTLSRQEPNGDGTSDIKPTFPYKKACPSSNQYRKTKPVSHLSDEKSVEYSGQSIRGGNGRVAVKTLDEPYKAYFPHTFGLKSADFLFGLM